MRRDVRERIAVVGQGGGLMLAPTHMVEPEVPWENIVAYVDAVKESAQPPSVKHAVISPGESVK